MGDDDPADAAAALGAMRIIGCFALQKPVDSYRKLRRMLRATVSPQVRASLGAAQIVTVHRQHRQLIAQVLLRNTSQARNTTAITLAPLLGL